MPPKHSHPEIEYKLDAIQISSDCINKRLEKVETNCIPTLTGAINDLNIEQSKIGGKVSVIVWLVPLCFAILGGIIAAIKVFS